MTSDVGPLSQTWVRSRKPTRWDGCADGSKGPREADLVSASSAPRGVDEMHLEVAGEQIEPLVIDHDRRDSEDRGKALTGPDVDAPPVSADAYGIGAAAFIAESKT